MKTGLMACLLWLLSMGQLRADNTPLVAVASSLRQVWPLLMAEFKPSQQPRVTFGSSGNLARQITQGAPFKLFLSADQTYPQWLRENGTTLNEPTTYTRGNLAWVALPNSSLGEALNEKNQRNDGQLFSSEGISRLSIANPAFAPYGQAAMDVLGEFNNLDSIELTLGENAMQALQFALSGASDGGIVPLSLVTESARLKLPKIIVLAIDERQHASLTHSMVLIGQPSSGALALFNFLLSDAAQTILAQNGFKALP